jgi:hypothetical protein
MLSRKKTSTKASWPALVLYGKNIRINIMSKILKESVLTTVPVMNPHAPSPQTGRQTPVEIPGVMYQTRELFQPVVAIPPQDKK